MKTRTELYTNYRQRIGTPEAHLERLLYVLALGDEPEVSLTRLLRMYPSPSPRKLAFQRPGLLDQLATLLKWAKLATADYSSTKSQPWMESIRQAQAARREQLLRYFDTPEAGEQAIVSAIAQVKKHYSDRGHGADWW
jgi:hypothetical protein